MHKGWVGAAIAALVAAGAVGYLAMHRRHARDTAEPHVERVSEVVEAPVEPPAEPAAAPNTEIQPARTLPSKDETPPLPTPAPERAPAPPKAATAAPVPTPTPAPPPPNPVRVENVTPPAAAPAAAPTSTSPPSPPAESDASAPPTPPVDDAESDRRPPTLRDLRFDPPQVASGGTAMLTIGTADDLSGVRSAYGTLRSPSRAAILTFTGQDAGDGTFVAKIDLPPQAEGGDWYVANLQIVDRAANPTVLGYERATVPPGGLLHVVSEDADSTAPTVRSIRIEKPSLAGGETNRVVFEVDDDRSGVVSVSGAFRSPAKNAYLPFSARAGEDVGFWESVVEVPEHADCGEWTLALLRLLDKAKNMAALSAGAPELDGAGFVVSGSASCDAEPPTVDSIELSPTVVSNASASEIAVTIWVHDAGSGVGSLSGRMEGPVSTGGSVPSLYFASEPDPTNPSAPLTAKVSVPQFAAKGMWKVGLLQVLDKARNARTYNPGDSVLTGVTFTVE